MANVGLHPEAQDEYETAILWSPSAVAERRVVSKRRLSGSWG